MRKKVYTSNAIAQAKEFYRKNGTWSRRENDSFPTYVGIAPGYRTMIVKLFGADENGYLYTVRQYNKTPKKYM